jgi:hypothetical protein
MNRQNNQKSSSFAEVVKRAQAGEFREYWLQRYIQENYKKLGFSKIEGPFEVGPDLKGIYRKRKVNIEAETVAENFIYHRHDPTSVDVLVILSDGRDKDVLGMSPKEWRARLPAKIIRVDAEDFVTSTHEMRKAYALMKQQQAKSLPMKIRFAAIRGSFEILWSALTGEDAPIEGTPEWDAFKDAASRTAAEYIQLYGVEIGDHFTPNPEFTRIEILANDIIKSHRDFSQLTREEKDFVENWIGVLREHYGSSV